MIENKDTDVLTILCDILELQEKRIEQLELELSYFKHRLDHLVNKENNYE